MLKSIFQQKTLKDILLSEKKLLTEDEWNPVEDLIDEGNSEVIAVSKVYGARSEITKEIAKYLDIDIVELLEIPKINPDLLTEIDRQIIFKEHIFPFDYGENRSVLKIAFVDPANNDVIENVERRTNKTIIPYHASWEDIENSHLKYYGQAEAEELVDIYVGGLDQSREKFDANTLVNTDSPIVKIVDNILEQAAKLRTSDIHIEPFETFVKVRYRIDGHLVEKQRFKIAVLQGMIARLKVMGGMDISEKRIPQDGRITFMVDKTEYDIRVSMLPTVYGEKCVMRLAVRANLQRDKKDLGLTPYDLKIFDKIFANPNGIILVTGPTGSGKSTTLYTALNELCTEDVNVVTVEDPVEANVPNVNQVQTNAKAGLTFAAALRSILRQDPDIIMIGEIRDTETAEIAVQAAVTGHLVVSTLHTNSAAATVTRLINMGLEPYLVADSVVGILAQRLVRRLCPRCKKEKMASEADLRELGVKPGTQLKIYEKGGCAHCGHTGYAGRIAVYEIMDVGPEIKEMIMNNATTAEIKRTAVAAGMHTLHRSAAELVIKGMTTIQEMKRVSSET